MITFHGVNLYNYIYVCVTYAKVLYTSLRNLHHSGGLDQLMGVACNRMHARLYRPAG